jgi:cellulose synthase/poly-beta-1,6-N-acetylglucosamine synthase-like glycosyltransferase
MSIKNKLEDTMNLDYPKQKLEIIVASDNSTDRTNEIIRDYSQFTSGMRKPVPD